MELLEELLLEGSFVRGSAPYPQDDKGSAQDRKEQVKLMLEIARDLAENEAKVLHYGRVAESIG